MSKTIYEKKLNKIERGLNFARVWDSKKSIAKYINQLKEFKDNYSAGYQFQDCFNRVASKKSVFSGYTLLHQVVEMGMVKEAQELIEMGADVNAKADVGYQVVDPVPADGFLPHQSAKFAIPDYIYQRMQDATPLHIAAFNDNIEMCKMLVEHKANKSAMNGAFETPQGLAKDVKLKEVLEPSCKSCNVCRCATKFKYPTT